MSVQKLGFNVQEIHWGEMPLKAKGEEVGLGGESLQTTVQVWHLRWEQGRNIRVREPQTAVWFRERLRA